MIVICNLKTKKPKYKYDVSVCRPSVLGNPYKITTDVSRRYVCALYEKYFDYHSKKGRFEFRYELTRLKQLYKKYGKLRLFCWCTPKRCHAETIKKYILKTSNKKKKSK